jgi:DNA repair exonuclease SbcCD ATPase subunit
MAPEKDSKPPDPGIPPERAKKKATRIRLLARLRMQQDQKDSGHVTRTIEQTPVDRTKQPNPRLKKRGATADTAPGNSGTKQAITYPSEDDRSTWQAKNGRPNSARANPFFAAADEKLASLEAKLTKTEDKTSRITTELADLQTQKEDLEDRLEKAQEHLRNFDAAVADMVAEVQHLKVQAAHLEGKLIVFEKFQPYQGEQPSNEIVVG